MVPEETQEDIDCLPIAQSKSFITQPDAPGMVGPVEDVSLRIPEAAFIELPFNVEEALIREENLRTSRDAHTVLDQEFAFPFPGPASTLEFQGSARSYQGVQGSFSLPSSSEHLTLREASSGGFKPPNISYGASAVNTLVDTSLPNNPMGQNPQPHFPVFTDPFEYELEKVRREQENLKKNFEATQSKLKAELKKKMAEACSEYDRQSQDVDAAYNAKVMEEEAIRSFVGMSCLLANAFTFKCTENNEDTDVAAFTGISIQQQQAVQTNTNVNSTVRVQPSVTPAEAPIPNSSGPLLQFPGYTTTQPTLISQQAEQSNTNLISTSPPRPSVTAAEAPIPNPTAPLLHFPCRNTAPSTPISQQAAVQLNNHVNSTPPPQPSVTAAEASIPNPSAHLPHFPRRNTSQPTSMSQQAAVQSNTHVNLTAPPQPSVTAAKAPIPNLSGPLSHFPRWTTTQPRLGSQQAAVQSNMHMNSTALPRPTVTSQPRPPPIISNLTPSSYRPVHGIVRSPAPHLQRFRSSRAPNSAAAAAITTPTPYPRRLEQQQREGTSSGGVVYISDDED